MVLNRQMKQHLPDSFFAVDISHGHAWQVLDWYFFVLAYSLQQGIPQDTGGDPSHYYMPKSGCFLGFSIKQKQKISLEFKLQ